MHRAQRQLSHVHSSACWMSLGPGEADMYALACTVYKGSLSTYIFQLAVCRLALGRQTALACTVHEGSLATCIHQLAGCRLALVRQTCTCNQQAWSCNRQCDNRLLLMRFNISLLINQIYYFMTVSIVIRNLVKVVLNGLVEVLARA